MRLRDKRCSIDRTAVAHSILLFRGPLRCKVLKKPAAAFYLDMDEKCVDAKMSQAITTNPRVYIQGFFASAKKWILMTSVYKKQHAEYKELGKKVRDYRCSRPQICCAH